MASIELVITGLTVNERQGPTFPRVRGRTARPTEPDPVLRTLEEYDIAGSAATLTVSERESIQPTGSIGFLNCKDTDMSAEFATRRAEFFPDYGIED